jgi:SAM-dependent methyltransferase
MTGIGYDEISARRYARVESRPDSFSLRLAPRIQRLFERGRRVGSDVAPTMLDIGCGTGQLTDHFRQAGYATVGVDRSSAMLRHRVAHRSGHHGAVVTADAAHLPLVGRFDLITATFNVINHLPDKRSVASLVSEVGRLLKSDGLLVFDLNTALGLTRTAGLAEIFSAAEEYTVWTRHWAGELLVLDADGSFVHDDVRYRYHERITKLVVQVSEIDRWCAGAGLRAPSWRSDDLVTPLQDPEHETTVYGIVFGAEAGRSP